MLQLPKILHATLLLTLMLTVEAARAQEEPGSHKYLFSYFTGNGEDGLHLAASEDGLTWTALNDGKSFLTPQVGDDKLMRDPCITQGPDGTFHMVWTTGWWDQGIGIAHSKDLINWSEQKLLPVMKHEPKARNCWAPEVFYDEATEQYLIYWSTTIPGRFPKTDNAAEGETGIKNHRIYYVTTKDFETYSDTKLLYDDGFNVIDATIVTDDDRYVMFIKDETFAPKPEKNIRIATSDSVTGPYSAAGTPFSPEWVEGPTVLRVDDWWYVYYDAYRRHQFEGARSKDLERWESITEQLEFPSDARHGTAFKVSQEIYDGLRQAEK